VYLARPGIRIGDKREAKAILLARQIVRGAGERWRLSGVLLLPARIVNLTAPALIFFRRSPSRVESIIFTVLRIDFQSQYTSAPRFVSAPPQETFVSVHFPWIDL
jgi:hypothetical protein